VAYYYAPGVVHSTDDRAKEKKVVSVSAFAAGVCPECVYSYQLAWITNEDVVRSIGHGLANMRLASHEYGRKHPEKVNQFPSWDTIHNGWQTKFRPITIKQDDKNFGLIHGDLHTGNFMLDQQADKSWETSFIDFDNTQQGFYMVDLGTVAFYANIELLGYVPQFLTSEVYKAYMDQFKFWITDEYEKVYGEPVDPQELQQGCDWRQDFTYEFLKIAVLDLPINSSEYEQSKWFIDYYDSGNMPSC